MMIFSYTRRATADYALAGLAFLFLAATPLNLSAQVAPTSNTSQQLVFAGLRSASAQGDVIAVKADAAGNLYLLLNEGDGVRVLKTDNAGNAVLAHAQLGAAGDAGTGLALDPTGNVYVAGTTSSASFAATGGAAFGTRTGSSINSFVARFDPALQPVFVTLPEAAGLSPQAWPPPPTRSS